MPAVAAVGRLLRGVAPDGPPASAVPVLTVTTPGIVDATVITSPLGAVVTTVVGVGGDVTVFPVSVFSVTDPLTYGPVSTRPSR